MLAGSKDHDFASVIKAMSNGKKFLNDMKHFDFDSVSGPQLKRLRSLELYSVEDMKKNSAAAAHFANVLLCARDYYNAKQAKTQAFYAQQ